MVSHTRKKVGGGLAFGLNESLDQAGATIGLLIIALVLARHGGYRTGFAALLISALLCLGMVIATQRIYPNPEQFEANLDAQAKKFPRAYWWYLAGSAMIGFGFVDFSLIAFHFQKTGAIAGSWIPISYAVAMRSGAIGNLMLGRLFDKLGFVVLIGVFLIGSLFTPLVFFGRSAVAVLGMALWGINMGGQDTILKPAIGPLIAAGRRTTAFGLFDAGFGAAWLVGSVAFGLLYGKSVLLLVLISVLGKLVSLPIFFLARQASQAAWR